MGGHQVELWHPGILAKWYAGLALARAVEGQSVWLWVDQDDNDPTRVRVPTCGDGKLGVGVWELAPGVLVPTGTATGCRDVIEPGVFDGEICAGVREGACEEIVSALRTRRNAGSLGEQMALAVHDLLGEHGTQMGRVFATRLVQTTLFGELVERMRREPRAMASAYNEACEAFGDAGIRALTVRGDVVELPMWRVRQGEARMPVYSTQLGEIPPEQLAPRALLMTGIVRLGACDIFVHGMGGARYDRVTERWFEAWLGETLSPAVACSATLLLDLGQGRRPSEREVDRARGLAHRALHDPGAAGDAQAGRIKRELLVEIEAARERGENPGQTFHAMHEMLADYRRRRAEQIAQIEREAQRLEDRLRVGQIADDRTWAFPLHEGAALAALEARIMGAIGARA